MRAEAKGRFMYAAGRKVYLRGVTYGTFAPGADGLSFPPPETVADDFAMMRAAGINSVRTYTPAPRWLLDLAQQHGLWVMAGLPWEEHVTFLDQRDVMRAIEARVRTGVRSMAGHPALLAYTIGNEIPGGISRWHGRRPMERFIRRLYEAAKDEDPEGLATYVNFPTTEYLQLPFVDFMTFNVYLEQRQTLERYLARLHNIADELPLVMAEIGFDSRSHGEHVQATALEWQVGTAFESGCAGAYVFAWTDEWHRGGHDILDWDFGLVDRERRPKPALTAVAQAFERLHRDTLQAWPPISVAVCTHNGAAWLPGCLEALAGVDYPEFEVIVVSDGSDDATARIAESAGVRLVAHPENRGLSAARNTALGVATGDILAYLDDDARPDPDWLRYLALTFDRSEHAAVGGPNIAPATGRVVADCVAHSPGGPVHVLLTDEVAEHVPGCNLAVRRDALAALGGFDERFRIAGDDVDVCWRIQDAGGTIGYSPGAMVWHHRRDSLRSYVRQQRNYGRAEALLERKWPWRYNRLGHLTWAGRIYGAGSRMRRPHSRARVRYGTWNAAPFQSIYEPGPATLGAIALMPESLLVLALLAVVSLLGVLWSPLLVALPVFLAGATAVVVRAYRAADRSDDFAYRRQPLGRRAVLRALTTFLHVLQPVVRLTGRLEAGLTPWRHRAARAMAFPRQHRVSVWSEQWASLEAWLGRLEERLHPDNVARARGTDWDRWDLQVRGGPFGVARLLGAVEEHGAGRQLVRLRVWPVPSRGVLGVVVVLAGLTAVASLDGPVSATVAFLLLALVLVCAMLYDCGRSVGALLEACDALRDEAVAAAAAAREHGDVPAANGAPATTTASRHAGRV